jgi:hypothetical protein
MRTSHSIRTLLAVLPALLFAPAVFAGGSCSGGCGGSVCVASTVNGGAPILLDLALGHPSLSDPSSADDQLTTSRATDHLGIDYADLSQSAAMKLALERVKKWEEASTRKEAPNTPPAWQPAATRVENALKGLQFMKTPAEFHQLLGASIPESSACAGGHSHEVIHYFDSHAAVSIPGWNALGLKSRAGLLIHEALREIQNAQGTLGDDATLERLTDKILMTDPKPGESLDDEPFFQLHISEPSFSEMKEKTCHLIDQLPAATGIAFTDDELKNRNKFCSGPEVADIVSASALLKGLNRVGRCTADPNRMMAVAVTMMSLMNVWDELFRGSDRVRQGVDSAISDAEMQLFSMEVMRMNYDSSTAHQPFSQRTFDYYNDYLKYKWFHTGEERLQMDAFEKEWAPKIRAELGISSGN